MAEKDDENENTAMRSTHVYRVDEICHEPLRSRSNSTPTTTIISGGGGVGADMIMVATVVVGVMTPQIMISLITR